MNSIIFSYWIKQICHPNWDHCHLASTVRLCMCPKQNKTNIQNDMWLTVQALLQTLNSMHTFCICTPVRRHCSRLSHAWYTSVFLQGNKDLYFICFKNIFSLIGYLFLILFQVFDYIQWEQSRLWNNTLKIKTSYSLRWIFKPCAKEVLSHFLSDYRFDCARCWKSWMSNQFDISRSTQNFAGSDSDFTMVQLHRLHKELVN